MSHYGLRLRGLSGHDALMEHGAAPTVVYALEPGTQLERHSGRERPIDLQTTATVEHTQQRIREMAQCLGCERQAPVREKVGRNRALVLPGIAADGSHVVSDQGRVGWGERRS
jgi:hypothetical protein